MGLGRRIVHFDRGTNQRAAKSILSSSPGVLYAEPDYIYEASEMPNDPLFTKLWGLHNTGQSSGSTSGTLDADIDAPDAWERSTGDESVTVAVVDSGVAYDHPDLAGQIWRNPGESGDGKEDNGRDDDGNGYVDDWRGWDWIDDDGDPRDLNSHGTHVAGTIGAEGNNGVGITGVAQQIEIVALRTLDADGAGRSSDIAAAFDYAGRAGIDVVNASLGGSSFSQTLLDSIGRWPGTLFVVAAGNSSANVDLTPSYPCSYPSANLICVTATTPSDGLASFSNYGTTSVDLAAPGYRIASTIPSLASPFSEGFESPFEDRWDSQGSWLRLQDEHGFYLSDGLTSVTPGLNMIFEQRGVLSLSETDDCRLAYVADIDLNGKDDRFLIEGSRDGGPWSVLDAWTGSSQGGWVPLATDLSALEGSEARLRIRLVTGQAAQGSGLEVDDLEVICTSSRYTEDSYGYMSGTSMATPHVAGAAALALSVKRDLDPAALIALLMETSDPVPSLLGKTVSGGRANIASALGVLQGVEAPDEEGEEVPISGLEPPLPTTDPAVVSPSPTATLDQPDNDSDTGSPSPAATPDPQSEEQPEDEQSPGTGDGDIDEHSRSVVARLAGHLVVTGSVKVDSGVAACSQDVPIRVERAGELIAKTRTDQDGRFQLRLPDRPGRYVVVAPQIVRDPGPRRCLSSLDRKRHLH